MPGTVAIVQARMGASRFPGKVLTPLLDKPLLRWVLDRLAQSRRLDRVVIATSDAAGDDVLAQRCREWNVPCFRGSESDVLGRFHAAAQAFAADTIVRINADNPLIDPAAIDQLVDYAQSSGCEYVSFRRGDGKPVMLTALSFFAEVLSRSCLDRADGEIFDRFDREHVTLGIYQRPEQFDVHWLPVPPSCNDARIRLTIDTPADAETIEQVLTALGPKGATATADEIARLVVSRPEWLAAMAAVNAAHPKSAVAC